MLVPAMIAQGDDMWMPQPMNDVEMLWEKYGDKLVFGVNPPAEPEGATDEEVEELAKAFAAKYAPEFDKKPIVVTGYGMSQRYQEAIYRQSRIALCGE